MSFLIAAAVLVSALLGASPGAGPIATMSAPSTAATDTLSTSGPPGLTQGTDTLSTSGPPG